MTFTNDQSQISFKMYIFLFFSDDILRSLQDRELGITAHPYTEKQTNITPRMHTILMDSFLFRWHPTKPPRQGVGGNSTSLHGEANNITPRMHTILMDSFLFRWHPTKPPRQGVGGNSTSLHGEANQHHAQDAHHPHGFFSFQMTSYEASKTWISARSRYNSIHTRQEKQTWRWKFSPSHDAYDAHHHSWIPAILFSWSHPTTGSFAQYIAELTVLD